MVFDITATDPDKGLNIRLDPAASSQVQFSLPNGSTMTAVGGCEKSGGGTVWWEVENGQWTGWASARYLKPFDATAVTPCPVANFDPIGKGTIHRILGDVDGDGLVDAVHLSYDGNVDLATAWTGAAAIIQIQFADGGLSYPMDITTFLADGGPSVGIPTMPTFPDRVDPANTTRSIAVISSHYEGAATGAGLVHFIGELNCSPTVMTTLPVTPSAGNPQRPILCDLGGGGRTQLWALDGLSNGSDYLVTRYDYQNGVLVPQPSTTAGSIANDPEPTVC